MDPSSFNNPELQQFIQTRSSNSVEVDYMYGSYLHSPSPQQEKQRAEANEMIGKLTSHCWDKCITATPGSSFSSSESTCLTNCAQRYMDMAMLVMRRLQQ